MSRAAVKKIAYEVAFVPFSAWLAMLLIGAFHSVWGGDTWGYWTCVVVVTVWILVREGALSLWREMRDLRAALPQRRDETKEPDCG